MTELLFWETTIRRTPVSIALDIISGLALGVQFDGVQG